jgi:NADH-quinone oxidoreductase subunit J
MHPKPVYAAVYFVLVVLSVSGLSVLAAAEFLGVALIIVYGGAILVTYVFVIMLAQQGGEASYDRRAREPFAATAMGFALVAAATQAMAAGHVSLPGEARSDVEHALAASPAADVHVRTVAIEPSDPGTQGESSDADPLQSNVRAIGASLMTTYVVAVEVAGVLLLIAMVGAIVIARTQIEPDALTPAERAERHDDPGRAGREAKPF